jgi:transposase
VRAGRRRAPPPLPACRVRFNPIIRRFYQRLKQAGKPSKVVLVACMRKLLVSLNAMVKPGAIARQALKMAVEILRQRAGARPE